MIVTMSNGVNHGQDCRYTTMPTTTAVRDVELVNSNVCQLNSNADTSSIWRSPPPPGVDNTHFITPIGISSTPSHQPQFILGNHHNNPGSIVTNATKRDWNNSNGGTAAAASTSISPNGSAGVQHTPVSRSQTYPFSHVESADPAEESLRSSSKKSRPNNYIAPKVIAKTFNSQVGSLALSGAVKQVTQQQFQQQQSHIFPGNNNFRFNLRRQLSGSKIEAFLSNGEQDSMDVDDSTKPRSMSF